MVSTFLVLVTSCSMLVPVVPDGLNIPGPGDVQGALTNAHACWCLNRRKDRYVELLRLETGISPGVGKRLPLPQEVKFRGILPEPVPSAVASQGRRSYSLLPREDARQFRQLSDFVAGGRSLQDLVAEFGPVQWEEVRVLVEYRETADARGGHAAGTSSVTQLFEKLHRDLDAGVVDDVRAGLQVLEQALKPSSGMHKRAGGCGGVQYRALFMLDAVLLADNLRSLSTDSWEVDEGTLLQTVVRQSLSIALDPDLADHLSAGLRMPRKSALYQYRQSVDFCCMLWARKHLFSNDLRWISHVRLDSSPQYARNYLVGELDRIDLSQVSSARIDDVLVGPR